jgi:protein AATF/BFR2
MTSRKSKLRKPEVVQLGPAYRGSRVSRGAVEDSDDGFHSYSESDEEDDDSGEDDLFAGFKAEGVNGHKSKRGQADESEEDFGDLAMKDAENDSDEESDLEFDEEFDEDEQSVNGVETFQSLQKQDEKTMTSSLSEAMAQDAAKGGAIKSQRSAFDSLLNVRIRLQKALISVNSIPQTVESQDEIAEDAINGALDAATRLFNTVTSVRHSLDQSRDSTLKRKLSEMTDHSTSQDIWDQIQEQERSSKKGRNSTLDFWSSKLRPQQGANRLTGRTQQSLSQVLQGQLASDMSRLVEKTQMPRSCAPVQSKHINGHGESKSDETVHSLPIYDDADFYGLLLQTLITQRSSDASALSTMNVNFPTQPWQAAREAKTKKQVDTKASKGRRLRYTVHEKIQDLMPREDRTTWNERQTDELFASLLGRKIELQDVQNDEDIETDMKEFRLF